MMARKLLNRAWHGFVAAAWAGSLLISVELRAESQSPAGAAAIVVNPFATEAQASPETPPPAGERNDFAAENPFAAPSWPEMMPLPMLPASRWGRSALLLDEPAPVKSAILSAPAFFAPPVVPASTLAVSNPVPQPVDDPGVRTMSDLISLPETIEAAIHRSNPTMVSEPLLQPTWLEGDPGSLTTSPVGPASFNTKPFQQTQPRAVHDALHLSPIEPRRSMQDDALAPQLRLKQAQETARTANTLASLEHVLALCELGLGGVPPRETATELRRLAAWAQNRRGELLAEAGDESAAEECFETAIALDPRCALALHNRAITRAERNQYDAALRDFDRTIELNPGLSIAYRNRAELLSSLGRMRESAADYSRAIEDFPQDPELYAARSHVFQRLGDDERAMADLIRAVQLAPENARWLTQRGNLAAERGRFGHAIADFRRAIAAEPEQPEAHRSLAWLHATCGDAQYRNPALALAAAEEAVRLSPPGDYLSAEVLAAAHAAVGNFDEAARVQRAAIAAAPAEAGPLIRARLQLYEQQQPFIAQANKTVRTERTRPHSAATPHVARPELRRSR